MYLISQLFISSCNTGLILCNNPFTSVL